MSNVHVICFLASYAVALGLESMRLLSRAAINRAVMLVFAAAGLVAHSMYLLQRSSQHQLPPLLSSTHDWMLVLAWLAIVFYLFFMLLDRELAIGLFLLPLVLVLIVMAYLVSDFPNPLVTSRFEAAEEAFRNWAMLHASLLVFGIAGVVLGFVLSMMYLAQHRRLKHKQTHISGLTLPSLERLARMNWWAVVVSVPLLTLGMATGLGLAVYTRTGDQPVELTDPVILIDGVVWLVMVGFFCWIVMTRRPAGKQVAWLTLWAFGFLLVTLIGLQVLAVKSPSLNTWHTQRSILRPFADA